jgi:hypothetical protein
MLQPKNEREATNPAPSKWNRGSSNWPVAGRWLCLALYSILVAHRFTFGAVQVGMALAYGADEFMARTASRWRLNLIRVCAVAVLIGTFWPR